jgi:aspartate-semialdehyde dehydrogenase
MAEGRAAMATNLRGVVVGASTLLGKELIEELNTSEPAWDLRLSDSGDSSGQLIAGGDEALLVQPLSPDIFNARDVAFFASEPETTRKHWREAQTAGATVIDMTAALESEAGAVIRSPWILGGTAPLVDTPVIIPAHPAAVMLGIVASRLTAAFGRVRLAATVLEPASQQGSRGLDEMHQQTVSLLGFHALPQGVYDGQVAFNLRIGFGEAAKLDLSAIASTVRRDLEAIAGELIASSVALQLVQAPVFHGYTMSVYVQFSTHADLTAIRRVLHGGIIHLVNPHEEAPTNQSVAEEPGIAIALTEESSTTDAPGFWLWIAADNLKLAARHAIACAEELATLRATNAQ